MSTETAELTIEQRVAAGAAWLDEHRPGWVEKVDVETLDVATDCNCILGQIFGHFQKSPDEARWSADAYLAASRGFNVGPTADEDEETAEFAALTAEWRRLIESRRAAVE